MSILDTYLVKYPTFLDIPVATKQLCSERGFVKLLNIETSYGCVCFIGDAGAAAGTS
jgi:hypothetical protein